MDKQAILEGVKQMLRVALFAALPVVVASLQAGETDWKVIGFAAFVAVLAGVDKYIHKDENIPLNGITPW